MAFDPEKSTQKIKNNNEDLLNGLEELLNKRNRADASFRSLDRQKQDLKEIISQLSNIDNIIGAITEKEINPDILKQKDSLEKQQEKYNQKIKESEAYLKEYYNISQEQLEIELERFRTNEDINKSLEEIELKRKQIRSDTRKPILQKYKELDELDEREKAENNKKDRLQGKAFDDYNSIVKLLGGKDSILGKSFINKVPNEDRLLELLDKTGNKIEGPLNKLVPGLGSVDRSLIDVKATTKLIENGIKELRGSMTKSINQAAASIQSYYGRINANLENSGLDYDKISDDVQNNLGFSRLIKQTDYLNQIASLTDQGLVEDIEQRALLQTIKDKTLTSFDVANAGLTRLVRLGEQGSVQQFGLELQLKKLLNSKILGDASYLRGLFDSVTSTIIDAGVSGKGDITNFNSTVQTWLGAMYASGLSDNVVSSIASGVNALGSGNVNALASDESTQRLFLLAMDRINMNYADILQQGLSAADTNKLLESIINLLYEISGKTDNNLVLKSSYSNLFNLSISDLKAIQNVHQNMSTISKSIVNESDAIAATNYAVSTQVAKNTKAFEQFENFFANFNYSFGSNVAENNVGYTAYRIADITYNLFDQFSQVGGILGSALGKLKNAAAITQLGIGGLSALSLFKTAVSGNNGGFGNASLTNLLGDVTTYSGARTSINYSTSNSSESNFKSFWNKEDNLATVNKIQTDVKAWEGNEEDKVLAILQKFEGAIMQLKSSKEKYAVAVSLQGMDDEVLKSFASIFADEDALLETFTGKNNVFKDALFEYTEDTTSNSKKKK